MNLPFFNYDFTEHTQILAVYLFDSKATGEEHYKSDIVIEIIVDNDFNLFKLVRRRAQKNYEKKGGK